MANLTGRIEESFKFLLFELRVMQETKASLTSRRRTAFNLAEWNEESVRNMPVELKEAARLKETTPASQWHQIEPRQENKEIATSLFQSNSKLSESQSFQFRIQPSLGIPSCLGSICFHPKW